jgi:hypothetical protein
MMRLPRGSNRMGTRRRAGALGGKILGAGAGGFLVFYAPEDRHPSVERALAAAGQGLLQPPVLIQDLAERIQPSALELLAEPVCEIQRETLERRILVFYTGITRGAASILKEQSAAIAGDHVLQPPVLIQDLAERIQPSALELLAEPVCEIHHAGQGSATRRSTAGTRPPGPPAPSAEKSSARAPAASSSSSRRTNPAVRAGAPRGAGM